MQGRRGVRAALALGVIVAVAAAVGTAGAEAPSAWTSVAPTGGRTGGSLVETLVVPADGSNPAAVTTKTGFREDRGYRLVIKGRVDVRRLDPSGGEAFTEHWGRTGGWPATTQSSVPRSTSTTTR